MKTWTIRIVALAAVVGCGWFGISLAQQRLGKEAPAGPDLSKPPVNAEAAGWSGGAASNGATASDRAPVDPFQGLALTGGRSDAGAASNYANSTNASARDRYPTTEPQRFDADPRAVPIAPEPTDPYRRGAAADASAAPVDPFAMQRSATPIAADDTAADPRATQRGPRGSAIEIRNNDPDANTARQTAGFAEPTGSVEAAADPRDPQQTSRSAAPQRYDDQSLAGSQYPADDRQPAGSEQFKFSDQKLPNGGGPGTRTSSASDQGGFDAAAAARNFDAARNTRALSNSGPNGAFPDAQSTGALRSAVTPAAAAAAATGISAAVNIEGLNKPGDKKLEGAQTPSVTIEKIAPPEIQVGKPAKFELIVRNTGPVTAEEVQVIDVVPQGTELVGTTPRTTVGQRGEIVWQVGDVRPGEEAKLQVDLMPTAEGEIGSMAVVQFRSTASVRTVATKPELVLEVNAPKQVMIGEDVTVKVKLSNPGTGAASRVVLQANVPPGFQHPAGTELEFDAGQFQPGESRDFDLTLHAVQAGPFSSNVVATSEANLRTEKKCSIEVIAPRVKVELTGPGLRYLDRQAKYTVAVSNPGTAPARDIQLVTRLPKGMQFVEASDSGRYDAGTNSVMWALAELPAGQSGNVTLTTLAKDQGDQKFRSEVRAAGGLTDGAEQTTVVEGVAAVLFTVVDVDDPVEVGGKVTYEIRVVNQGSKAAGRLQVMATFPAEIRPVSADGAARNSIEGQNVVFEPLARLAPKADVTYRVVGQCLAPGDMRVTVQLLTEDMAKPVTKEESTRVYKD